VALLNCQKKPGGAPFYDTLSRSELWPFSIYNVSPRPMDCIVVLLPNLFFCLFVFLINGPLLVALACFEQVELSHADISQCKWAWFRQSMEAEVDSASSSTKIEHGVVLGTSRTYWPSEEDVGHQLLLECTPASPMGKVGDMTSCLSPSVVLQGPEDTPIHRRHLHTPWQLADMDKFRMVSYNTLAGVFTQEEYAKTVLYPYCDPDALTISYRECLLMREVVGYNADIVNLQEVTSSTFNKYLQPAFDDKGYSGLLQLKAGSVGDKILYVVGIKIDFLLLFFFYEIAIHNIYILL